MVQNIRILVRVMTILRFLAENLEKCQKWPKMAENSPKMAKNGQNSAKNWFEPKLVPVPWGVGKMGFWRSKRPVYGVSGASWSDFTVKNGHFGVKNGQKMAKNGRKNFSPRASGKHF